MPIITLAETKEFLNIDSTDTDFDNQINAHLPKIADRVRLICKDSFTIQPMVETVYRRWHSLMQRGEYLQKYNRDTTLYILPQVYATFFASNGTVIARGENFASVGFAAGQDVFIRDSYRNDGYFEVSAVSTSTMTIASTIASTGTIAFADEATGASVYIAVVDWPQGIKPLVASLIQFDFQERGSWKESETGGFGVYGYPKRLLKDFLNYTKLSYGKTAI